jgi:hypothetical protein
MLQDREQEDADERPELPDADRDAVAGGAQPDGDSSPGRTKVVTFGPNSAKK